MSDDLERFENWAVPLIAGLSSNERLKLSRQLGQKLRRSQSQRIAAQMNPDGTPFEPRKEQPQSQARQRQGRIRRTMFNKLKAAKFMRIEASAEGVAIAFVGRVSRIARVHQEGLTDQVQPDGPQYQYSERKLLGWSESDIELVREVILNFLENIRKA